jgi:hypothetical protein
MLRVEVHGRCLFTGAPIVATCSKPSYIAERVRLEGSMPIARALQFLLQRAGLHARLQEMWRRDIARAAATAALTDKTIGQLNRSSDDDREWQRISEARLNECEARLAQSDVAIQALQERLAGFERATILDNRQARLAADWPLRFKPADIRAHVVRAVHEASMHETPGAHLVVDRLLPPDFYEFLLASLPGADLFLGEPMEMDLGPGPFDLVPRLTRLLWEFVATDVADSLAGAALERLRGPVLARYEAFFGREHAAALLATPHGHWGEGLTLRRRGYRERPHVDPKRASIAVLIGLTRRDTPEAMGMTLYSIDGDFLPIRTGVSHPESHGLTCRPVSSVPVRPNSALILVNAGMAHAIEIPDEESAAPELPRYGFHFYVGPSVQMLIDIASTLPPADQQPWLGLAGAR